MIMQLTRKRKIYDVTIFQTPEFRQRKGYKEVYRVMIDDSSSHEDCLEKLFKKFNVPDRIPNDFQGRFISTGDILYIDEGRGGQYYYQLKPGGWEEINRVHVR